MACLIGVVVERSLASRVYDVDWLLGGELGKREKVGLLENEKVVVVVIASGGECLRVDADASVWECECECVCKWVAFCWGCCVLTKTKRYGTIELITALHAVKGHYMWRDKYTKNRSRQGRLANKSVADASVAFGIKSKGWSTRLADLFFPGSFGV